MREKNIENLCIVKDTERQIGFKKKSSNQSESPLSRRIIHLSELHSFRKYDRSPAADFQRSLNACGLEEVSICISDNALQHSFENHNPINNIERIGQS